MVKKINDPAQLREWFSIEPYSRLSGLSPHEATQAVDNHLGFLQMVRLYDLTKSDVAIGMKWLGRCIKSPFVRFGTEPTFEMGMARRKAYLAEHCPEDFDEQDEIDREEELTHIEGKRIARLAAPEFFDLGSSEISKVTLWDVMHVLEQHQAMIAKVDAMARLVSEEKNVDFDDVRMEAYQNIALTGDDGSSWISIDGYPSAEVVSQNVRSFVLEHHAAAQVPYPAAGGSEVRKLFDYRAAAYIDLKIWERLTNSRITKKCMAVTLFPEGEYGELDLNPSRTVGKFFERLVHESGYMDSLIAKARQLNTLN